MTRETKIGLVVASSFLCLVGVVVASKFNQSKTQAEDAAVKAQDTKRDGNSETPSPVPFVSAPPGIIDPKVEKVASTLPPAGEPKLTLPAVPGIPFESPPAFPSAPTSKPESTPPVSAPGTAFPAPPAVSLPPVAEVKPLPASGDLKPPTEAPGIPFTSAEDDKLKRAMEQLKNESTKPRLEPNSTLALGEPPAVPSTSTPAPPPPSTPTPPPTLPTTPTAPVLPTMPPSIPPAAPSPPATTPTTPTLPSPATTPPVLPTTTPGVNSTPPVLPTTPPAGSSTPPTLPSSPTTSPTPTPPIAPTPSDFTNPQGNPAAAIAPPSVSPPPLVRPPMDNNLPSPFGKPEGKPPVDPLASRPSTAPVISDLPSDKKPPFVGTLADPNKVAPVLPSQPDTRTANGQKYLWQFQDSWENVSTRYFQSPKYAKALAAFNQRPQPVPGDTLLIPDASYLEQRFGQFVSNVGAIVAATPVAPPMGVSPVAPPMGITPITPPNTFTPTNPGVDLASPRPPAAPPVGTTTYRVPTGGKFITEVARETLRDEFQWGRIFDLNRHLLLNPSQRIPEGTILSIPLSKS